MRAPRSSSLCRRCSARLLHHGTADQPDVLAQRVRLAREFVGRVNLFDRMLDAIEILEPLVDRQVALSRQHIAFEHAELAIPPVDPRSHPPLQELWQVIEQRYHY